MKSVLITGCSNGSIGSAVALVFAQHGLKVFATTRNASSMSQLQNLPNVHLFVLDITDPSQIRHAFELVKKETGGTLDYLINNAGQARAMPLLDEPIGLDAAREIFEINVWSQLSMVQAFAPLLIEAKGKIVYVSSAAAKVSTPWLGM